jgi:hypothetical protein
MPSAKDRRGLIARELAAVPGIVAVYQCGGRRMTGVNRLRPKGGLTTHPGASAHVGADRDAGMPGTRAAD